MTDDLVKRLRSTAKAGSLLPPYPEVINAAADRIEELEAALRLADAALSGANMNMGVVEKKVRAAIGEKKDERARQ